MNDEQLLRYSRHILMPQIGIEGQERLLRSHVLVIGAGGLGSAAALYLGSAGVGTMTIVDHDTVDATNLQRQIAHTLLRIGQNKAASALQAVQGLNPDVRILPVEEKASRENLPALLAHTDIVLDCTDNFATRQLINAACVQSKKPLISGSAVGVDGQVTVFDPRTNHSPCYGCIFPPNAPVNDTPCSSLGVLAPLVGVVGCMQASQAIEMLSLGQASLMGKLVLLQAIPWSLETINLSRNPACPICAPGPQDHSAPTTARGIH